MPADRHSSGRSRVEGLFARYVRDLDDRRFAAWLELFADDAFYAVIRHEDHLKSNNLLVIGETKQKLRHRVEVGAEVDREMRVHLLTGIEFERAGTRLTASANFAVLRDAAITYAGQYRFDLVEIDGALKIARCLIVVENNRLPELLYLPL